MHRLLKVNYMRKKILHILLWAIASPFLLFLLACVLLLIPPIQNYAVDKVASIASEKTEFQISIDEIGLSLPFNLKLKGVLVNDSTQTQLLKLDEAKAHIQFLPLLRKEVEVDKIEVKGICINSKDYIEGIQVNGCMGYLALNSKVDMDDEYAKIKEIVLNDADLQVCYADTAEVDTTAINWKIDLDHIQAQNLKVSVSIPLDTMLVDLNAEQINLTATSANLQDTVYQIGKLIMNNGGLTYKQGTPLPLEETSLGLNPSHVVLTDVNFNLENIKYSNTDLQAQINSFNLKEQSGLAIQEAYGNLLMNSEDLQINDLVIKTPYSFVTLTASAQQSALAGNPQGLIKLRAMGDIGKADIMTTLGENYKNMMQSYPDETLHLQAGIDGTLNNLELSALNANIPGMFSFDAKGKGTKLTNKQQRQGEITMELNAERIDFINSFAEGYSIPDQWRLSGQLNLNGSAVGTHIEWAQHRTLAMSNAEPIDTLELKASMSGEYNLDTEAYLLTASAHELDLKSILQDDSIKAITADIHLEGQGLDLLNPHTRLAVNGSINRFEYGSYSLTNTQLEANLQQHQLTAKLNMGNSMVDINASVNGELGKKESQLKMTVDVGKLNWTKIGLSNAAVTSNHKFNADLYTNYKDALNLNASLTHNKVNAPIRSFTLKDLYAGFTTHKDTTTAFMKAGDLQLSFDSDQQIMKLGKQLDKVMAELNKQWDEKEISPEALKPFMPSMCLKLMSGKDNPIHNMLLMNGVSYNKLYVDMDTSTSEGINGVAYLHGLMNDSIALDTMRLTLSQDTAAFKISALVKSNGSKHQEAFQTMLDGNIGKNRAEVLAQYLNAKNEKGLYMGAKARFGQRGMRVSFFPESPTLVYRPFKLNERNHIILTNKGRLRANVHLNDGNGTFISFYTSHEDSTWVQDMTLEMQGINLKQFRRIIPYMPRMEGVLGTEIHYQQNKNTHMANAEMELADWTYEGYDMGSWQMSGIYMPTERGNHRISGNIERNGTEIVNMNGIYATSPRDGSGLIRADVNMSHFPLEIVNPMVPFGMVKMSGDIDGKMSARGRASSPKMNGSITLDNVAMEIPELSAQFTMGNKPVEVKDSKLLLKDFDIFTKGKTPFRTNGSVDFADFEKVYTDLRMKAKDYELINAKKNKKATTYGKVYVDVDATVKGALDNLVMRGNMNVLGKTNFTYLLKDSPLTVTDRLNDMVTFVNLRDTLALMKEDNKKVSLMGLDVAMSIHIDQAVRARADLNDNGSNYMLLEGGGDLYFQYTPQGKMMLSGRYTLNDGEMKYEIPVIPLKTFHIKQGSYLEWTGDMMNPSMNIVATERVRASVTPWKGASTRMVNFDVGIEMVQTLKNLGMKFTLQAPDDLSIQEELAAMAAEERGKLAVTMLVTGLYMAEGNVGTDFNMGHALNSFLQSEISSIAGKALDINLGMETIENTDDGGRRTDYNFQFAKRFWNNRFRIVIGGKVSTGNTAQKSDTFIDNVSIEYRLDNSATRYIKLFHNKNYESVLEGEITETGLGIVLSRKVSQLGELFIFRKKKENVYNE